MFDLCNYLVRDLIHAIVLVWCAFGFALVLSRRMRVVSNSLSVALRLVYTIKYVHNPWVVGVGGRW